jgi:hypothetical protein
MVDMVGGFGRSCWRKVEAVRKQILYCDGA